MNKYLRYALCLVFHFFFTYFIFYAFFFLCTMPIMPKVNSKKQLNQTTNKQDEPLKKKRKSLTAAQKKELCLKKTSSPFLKQKDLANEYDVSEGMVSDILKEKDRWLSVDTNSYQANLKRDKKTPFPLVEEALVIWVDNTLKASLIITDDILSTKVLSFAFLLKEDKFKGSSSWVDNFKK